MLVLVPGVVLDEDVGFLVVALVVGLLLDVGVGLVLVDFVLDAVLVGLAVDDLLEVELGAAVGVSEA